MPKTKASNNLPSHPADVLSMKGATAQQTTWQGNLTFYQLCEERFEAWKSHPERSPGRTAVAQAIVDRVHSSGGIFRKFNGQSMPLEQAIRKVMDRMRQIAKPKLLAKAGGAYDVVFCTGGTNHLYPFNPVFRSILDQYFWQYFPDFDPTTPPDVNNQVFQIRKKPPHQVKVLEELWDRVHAKGGCFRAQNLCVLSKDGAFQKMHKRFRDVRKIAQQRGSFVPTPVEEYIVKRTGVTSTRAVVREEEEEEDGTAEEQAERQETKRQQADSREERRKRRQELQKQNLSPLPKRKRRRSVTKKIKTETYVVPNLTPDMTEYERLRISNMKKNYERLHKLGLA